MYDVVGGSSVQIVCVVVFVVVFSGVFVDSSSFEASGPSFVVVYVVDVDVFVSEFYVVVVF